MTDDGEATGSLLGRLFPVRVALVCGVVVAVQLVLLGFLVVESHEPHPHLVPATVVAPAVVAQAVAAQADDLDGRPFVAIAADDPRVARDDVRRGLTTAALVVDLAHTTDVLVLNEKRDPRLNEAVRNQIVELEASYGRTVTVQNVSSTGVDTRSVYTLALLCCVVGFLLVVVVSLRAGPVARTLSLGVRRVLALAAVCVVLGYVATLPLGPLEGIRRLELALLVALTALVAAVLTLALEALAGLSGLGLSVVLFVVMATPLLLRTDPHLFPSPWPQISRWTPSGSAVEVLSAVAMYDGAGARRPALTLGSWLLVAVVALIVARQERDRAGAAPDEGLDEPVPALVPARRATRGRRVPVPLWRARVMVVVVPVAVVTLVVASFVPRDDVAASAEVASVASESPCLSTGQVTSVADLNRIAETLRGGPAFQGADVGADVTLQDGRRLMVFGDTLRSPAFSGQRFVRNSMLLFGPDCIQTVLPADHGALIPDRPSATGHPVGYWPMSVARITRPGYDLVAVTAQRVRSVGDDTFDFENLGPAVAVFVVAPGLAPQLADVRDLGADSTDPDRPAWGAATAVHGGWLYLYGTANPRQDFVFGFSLRVARVRPDDILDRSAWRYWDGQDWSRSSTDAVELIAAEGGTSQTLSVFEQDGTWYALSKRDEFLGTDVVVWSAPSPQGPFDDGQAVATLPSDAAQGLLRYMPLAHPDLLPKPGTMVVSYSRNRTDIEDVIDDPFLYRPHFLRVRMPD